ncbi:MAG TPA: energy transducer TonB [Candidatus Acidoferrales bacterium]|nr:energy transducer TonB [Candidatus Acidoferrales bacterium]
MSEQPSKPDAVQSSGEQPRIFRLQTETPRRGQLFVSNLKEFLGERPVKLSDIRGHFFRPSEFGQGFFSNLAEWFRPGLRRGGNSAMLVESRPWYGAFWDNAREALRMASVHPGPIGRPVEVGELWNPPRQYRKVQLLSLLGHAILALLILVPLFPKIMQPTVEPSTNLVPLDISPYQPMAIKPGKKAGGGGGGGERNPVPATRGRLPKFSMTQFSPPMAKILPNPKIQVQATVLGPPQLKLPSPNLPNYGDPLAALLTDSGGPGNGGGIGQGGSGGVGSGNGSGVGPGNMYGAGGGFPTAGEGGFGQPVCLYCPNPTFSDEAVKTKYQGTVLLRFVVTAAGTTQDIQVLRGLGMGLDQHAIDTVRTWRFKAAIGPNGRPATVVMMAEISFRLL